MKSVILTIIGYYSSKYNARSLNPSRQQLVDGDFRQMIWPQHSPEKMSIRVQDPAAVNIVGESWVGASFALTSTFLTIAPEIYRYRRVCVGLE